MIIKFILRNLRKSKLRTLLVLVSVILSAIVIFFNLSMSDSIEKLIRLESTKTYGNYNLMVTSEDEVFEAEDIDWGNLEIKEKTDILVTVLIDEYENVYRLNSLTLDDFTSQNLISMKSGTVELDKNEVIVDEESAEDNDWNIDDTISVYLPTGEIQDLKIAGIAYKKGHFAQSFSLPTLVSNIKYDRATWDYSAKDTSAIMCEVDNSEKSLSDIKEEIEESNEGCKVTLLMDETNIQTQISTVRMVLIILLLLVLMLNYYIISSNAKVILESRTSVLATFRSIGATRGKVVSVVLLENTVYGAIGGIIGCLIGYFTLEPVTNTLVGSSETNWPTDSSKIAVYIIFTVLFSIFVQVLCAMRHVVKFSKISIKNLLFEKSESVYKVSKIDVLLGVVSLVLAVVLYLSNSHYNLLRGAGAMIFTILGLVGIVPVLIRIVSNVFNFLNDKINNGIGQLVAKSLGYNKTCISNAILITIALSIMLSVYMLSLGINSMFKGAEKILSPNDIQISNITKELKEYDAINDIQEIESKTGYYYSLEKVTVNKNEKQVFMVGIDEDGIGITSESDYKIEDLKKNECLVDSYYALRNGIELEDKVVCDDTSFTVKGFVDANNFQLTRNVVVIPTEQYVENISEIPMVIYAHMKEGSDENEIKSKIKEELALENVSVITFQEHIDTQRSTVSNIMLVVWIILALAVIMSVIGIINNQMIGFLQRQREYAVLNSVAMSMGQILASIFFEMLSTFILGCILGSVASLWLSVVLKNVLYSVGIALNVQLDYVSIMKISVGTLCILMFSSIIPISKIRRINLVEVIKSDR